MVNNFLMVLGLLFLGAVIGLISSQLGRDKGGVDYQPSRWEKFVSKVEIVLAVIRSRQLFIVTDMMQAAQIRDKQFIDRITDSVDMIIDHDDTHGPNARPHDHKKSSKDQAKKWLLPKGDRDE